MNVAASTERCGLRLDTGENKLHYGFRCSRSLNVHEISNGEVNTKKNMYKIIAVKKTIGEDIATPAKTSIFENYTEILTANAPWLHSLEKRLAIVPLSKTQCEGTRCKKIELAYHPTDVDKDLARAHPTC